MMANTISLAEFQILETFTLKLPNTTTVDSATDRRHCTRDNPAISSNAWTCQWRIDMLGRTNTHRVGCARHGNDLRLILSNYCKSTPPHSQTTKQLTDQQPKRQPVTSPRQRRTCGICQNHEIVNFKIYIVNWICGGDEMKLSSVTWINMLWWLLRRL